MDNLNANDLRALSASTVELLDEGLLTLPVKWRHLVHDYVEGGEGALDAVDKIKLTQLSRTSREALDQLHLHFAGARAEDKAASNAQAKEWWKNKLSQQQAELTRESRQQSEAMEAALKEREKHVWLAQHPESDEVGFEKAWPHIFATITTSEQEAYIADRLAAKRAGGV